MPNTSGSRQRIAARILYFHVHRLTAVYHVGVLHFRSVWTKIATPIVLPKRMKYKGLFPNKKGLEFICLCRGADDLQDVYLKVSMIVSVM